MRSQSPQKLIYKIHSSRIIRNGGEVVLPLSEALESKTDIVALSDSQILRWIIGKSDFDERVRKQQAYIRSLKKLESTSENRKKIKRAYEKLYNMQFIPDYLCVIMDSKADYDKCNKGFSVNGIKFRRLLGTVNGVKKSVIVYINCDLYDGIKEKIDCDRQIIEIEPAKLEAYQALVCSGSIPVSMPNFIIVNDCEVNFKEDVITIKDDELSDEPLLEEVADYEINYCESDGYGLMLPSYSSKLNRELYGDYYPYEFLSGVNTRFAWTKGMLYTFDFLEFAKTVSKNYIVKDAWGVERDIRDYDVILTTSMVKLWKCYNSLEEFKESCKKYDYQFSVSKTTPHKLENARNSNYQFIQVYDELSDDDIKELCNPTLEEIEGALGGDYRKTLVFLKGMSFTEKAFNRSENDFIKGLMIEPKLLNDPFVIKKINEMIKKRINLAAKGSLKLHANFSIISGDLYSFAQSVFGLEVTGLLKKGEMYNKYWLDNGSDEVVVFRAPMSVKNNVRKLKVCDRPDARYWFKYVRTGTILNSWDTTCDATNGSDKDGDMFFITDNKILLRNTKNLKTIECMQRKAKKIFPNEKDIIMANKKAFGDEIGTITNRITSMMDVQAQFPKDSEEYKTLEYRIMCGQHFQQNSIDKAKGIIAKPMPKHWYKIGECKKLEDEDAVNFNLRIVASKKPYFMRYIYPALNKKYNQYIKNSNNKCLRLFGVGVDNLLNKSDLTEKEQLFLDNYKKYMPVGMNLCTINKICFLVEDYFNKKIKTLKTQPFDYTILKSSMGYDKLTYKRLEKLKSEYDYELKLYKKYSLSEKLDKEECEKQYNVFKTRFEKECFSVCPNEQMLCNALLDLCYRREGTKQFVWDMCGEQIIQNLLNTHDNYIKIPVHMSDVACLCDNDCFEFKGEYFIITERQIGGDAS